MAVTLALAVAAVRCGVVEGWLAPPDPSPRAYIRSRSWSRSGVVLPWRDRRAPHLLGDNGDNADDPGWENRNVMNFPDYRNPRLCPLGGPRTRLGMGVN